MGGSRVIIGRLVVYICVCAGLLAACQQQTPASNPGPDPAGAQTGAPVATVGGLATAPSAPDPATPTPEPLAATVNGAPITLADYDREVQRCAAGWANAGLDAAGCPGVVLQSLIEQAVVEQTAAGAGISVPEADLEAELERIAQEVGGAEAMSAWLTANLYSAAEFREALGRDMLRARMAAHVTEGAVRQAEQVHARGLLVSDEATAQGLLDQIRSGADFATLALTYSLDASSRPAGGDLGWFPRGLLTMPEVEEAAFALQPGETSEVIRTSLGFHIIQTLERDSARPLSPEAERAVRARALETWLAGELARATVVTFVNP